MLNNTSALLIWNHHPLTSMVIACPYAALTGPQITQTPYTLHSFLLCSHSEALVSKTVVKEFPVEAHCSLGLALYLCVCALYITTGFHQCHEQIISPWRNNEGIGRQSDWREKYFPPEDLCSIPSSPHNLSLAEHFPSCLTASLNFLFLLSWSTHSIYTVTGTRILF